MLVNCDQCQMLSIQGYATHEAGCPNANKTWSEEEQSWIKYVVCFDCGFDIKEGTECDCSLPDDGEEL